MPITRAFVLIAMLGAWPAMATAQGVSPAGVPTASAPWGGDAWSQTVARLEQAALDGSSKVLRATLVDLKAQLAATPPVADEATVQYAVAYAAWRMATLPDVAGTERKELLAHAVTQLQAVVKRNPKDAEAHALLGSVYGLQIAESPMIRGMTLGPRASGALDRAADVDPSNPRVLLLQGVSAFNTPAMFGGGMDDAERLLRRSLERFSAEPATKPWPNWGRFDAHVWLGQTLVEKGDRAAARAEYDKALLLAPNSGWLRYVLLPALDKPAKGSRP